jgi:hypothetical protein
MIKTEAVKKEEIPQNHSFIKTPKIPQISLAYKKTNTYYS